MILSLTLTVIQGVSFMITQLPLSSTRIHMSDLHSDCVLLGLTTLKLFISLPLLKSYIPPPDLIWSCVLLACWEWVQLAKGDKWACAHAFTHSHYSFFSPSLSFLSPPVFSTYTKPQNLTLAPERFAAFILYAPFLLCGKTWCDLAAVDIN